MSMEEEKMSSEKGEAGEGKTHFGYRHVDVAEKEGLVKDVFDSVAEKYDLMNDLMSFGTHRLWKRLMVKKTGLRRGQRALDVAGGTGDIAFGMAELVGVREGSGGHITVFDINGEMLKYGAERAVDRGYLSGLDFVQGNAEAIPFKDNTFDCATVAFGIRNVTHLDRAFSEMHRVIKPGGRVVCLEFSHTKSAVFQKIYDLYSFSFLPAVGEAVTQNRGAYEYLAESIRKFPPQEELKRIMEEAGLYNVKYTNLFNGIAAIHVGYKV